jgi:HTH-type transcriptional repressor of NAD biosynthesis genes
MDKTIGMYGGKFLPLHLGHLWCIQQAAKRVDTLYVVLSSCYNRDKKMCDDAGIKYPDKDLRLQWLYFLTKDTPNVKILDIEDTAEDYKIEDWKEGAERIKKEIGEPIDFVFMGDPESYSEFESCYKESTLLTLDNNRYITPISATKIRENLFGNWEYLPKIVQKFFCKKVLLTGIESVGKTTLTKELTAAFGTHSVLEVGREYCEYYNNQLRPSDFDLIAMKHYLKQDDVSYDCNKVMFVDSDAIVTKFYLGMYCEVKDSEVLESIIHKQRYDLVLYLAANTPWVDDGYRFRKDENERREDEKLLISMYKHYWGENPDIKIITGDWSQRYSMSYNYVKNLIKGSKNDI